MITTIASFVALFSFILIIIGLVSPKIGLFWLKGKRTRLKSCLIYFFILCVSFGIIVHFDKPPVYGIAEIRAILGKGNVAGYQEIGGREILVKGKIVEIKNAHLPDGANTYVTYMAIVDLNDDKQYLPCFFADPALTKKLKVGDKISFYGRYECNVNSLLDCVWTLSPCRFDEKL